MCDFEYILLMKAGPYCGYSLDEIIEIKQEEQIACGKFYWGYSGVFCRPHTVNAFVSYAEKNRKRVRVLFSLTKSSFETSSQGKFTDFSSDKIRWTSLDKKILLVGNTSAHHFAITANNLCKIDTTINLSDYFSFTGMGMFPEKNKRLNEYFRYRVDKACGVYAKNDKASERLLHIDYAADLVDPYCVYIR